MVCLHKWQLEYTWFLSILLLTWFAHSNTMHGVRCGATYTEGRYGAGAGAGVLGWACFSSKVEFQGFAPGVLGDIGIVGVVGVTGISTYIDQGEKSFYNDQQNLLHCIIITTSMPSQQLPKFHQNLNTDNNTIHVLFYECILNPLYKKNLTFGLLKLLGPPEEVSSEGRLLRCPLPSPASTAPSPEAGAALRPSGSDWNIGVNKKISLSI